jgi:hypothetical protein
VILATQEAEIRRILVQSQSGEIVQETLSGKNPSQKRAGGVVQSVGLEFKPQYHKKQTNKQTSFFFMFLLEFRDPDKNVQTHFLTSVYFVLVIFE